MLRMLFFRLMDSGDPNRKVLFKLFGCLDLFPDLANRRRDTFRPDKMMAYSIKQRFLFLKPNTVSPYAGRFLTCKLKENSFK